MSEIPSIYSYIGLVWTLLTVYLFFSSKAKQFLSNAWLLVLTTAAMLISVKIIVADMSALTTIAGGLTPLDGRFLYGSQDIIEFADALGKDGRAEYAAFQLGTDALAPPAFACFYLNMIYATIKFKWVRQTLAGVLFAYFVAVLITNNATPIVFLQYPSQPGIVGWLYFLLPVLDAMKYVFGHLTQWLGLVSCWLFSLGFYLYKK